MESRPRAWAQLAQQKRLELIDFRLAWEGHVNRADLVSAFGISIPQATLDITRYQELNPQNAEYDRSGKEYVPTPLFQAAYETSNLDWLLRFAQARSDGSESPPYVAGWLPRTERIAIPLRQRPDAIFKAIIEAIRLESGLEVTYHSMTSAGGGIRTITPHTLVETNGRWHVRGYCHTRSEFRDFVISRFAAVHGPKQRGDAVSEDKDWNALAELRLAPLAELHPNQRDAVAEDYRMTDGTLTLSCRRALLFYTLQALGLEVHASGRVVSPQLELANAQDFAPDLLPKHDWLARLQTREQLSE